MDLFLLLGDNYVEDGVLGSQCHKKRVNFERLMRKHGKEEKLNAFYDALAEINLGRTNKGDKTSRIIDIDLLLYGDLILNNENLVIPHPLMIERAFVMIPLAEIAPNLIVKGYKKTVKEIANDLDSSLVEIFLES